MKSDFENIRDMEDSPIHIEPIYDKNTLIGYELRSTYHYGKWFKDIASFDSKLRIINKTRIELKNPKERYEVFDKDCCLLFNNIFYAEGKGLDIDAEILNIFKEHPNLSSRVGTITNPYFIYGKILDTNKAIGLQGNGLKFAGALGQKLLDCILKKIKNIKKPTDSSLENNLSLFQFYLRKTL